MGTTTVWDAWAHYESLRRKYRRKTVTISKDARETLLAALAEYLTWCDEKRLPPLLFMNKRFEAMYLASRRLAIPRVTQLKSDKLAAVWSRVESTHYADAQSERLHREMPSYDVQTIRDLRGEPQPHQETVKRRNSASPDGCLALFRFSGGYHPRSGWCQQCVNQGVCQRQLQATFGFDVAALRAGHLAGLPNHVLHAALG